MWSFSLVQSNLSKDQSLKTTEKKTHQFFISFNDFLEPVWDFHLYFGMTKKKENTNKSILKW